MSATCTLWRQQFFGHKGGAQVPGFHFHSDAYQDWAVANILHTGGILNSSGKGGLRYIDLATNDALSGSNTAFFDRCLGWNGLCIEPNPRYHPRISTLRSCSLEKACVNEVGSVVEFDMNGPLGHIVRGRRMASAVQCKRLDALLEKREPLNSFRHVNYMSLDIEGAELSALHSINWQTTTIDVMTVEKATYELVDFLKSKGMAQALCSSLDSIFVRQELLPAAMHWYEHHARRILPDCISNETKDCTRDESKFLSGAASFGRCQAYRKSLGTSSQSGVPYLSQTQKSKMQAPWHAVTPQEEYDQLLTTMKAKMAIVPPRPPSPPQPAESTTKPAKHGHSTTQQRLAGGVAHTTRGGLLSGAFMRLFSRQSPTGSVDGL